LEKGIVAKILVIDDEQNIRVLLDMLLRAGGYDVLSADNGWEGLELYCREHPDVILLDWRMPGLDGVTVLRQIRTVDLKQPVIVLTGDSSPETERQVRALGGEFFVKGFALSVLTDMIAHLVETSATVTAAPHTHD
jgi:DNA-binding response OmpR family regulator